MKIILFSRPRADLMHGEAESLLGAIERHGLEYVVNNDFADAIERSSELRIDKHKRYSDVNEVVSDTYVMICYGGDGTFLEGVRCQGKRRIPVAGINSGRLGFLASVPKECIDEAFEKIAGGEYEIEERTLLHVEGAVFNGYPYAINEFSIQRNGLGMISVEVYVDDEMVGRYWGDGAMVSTPSGSTAYALSVGGPIVTPECGCFVIAPIAPHNLTMRPVIIPDSGCVTLRADSREVGISANLDNCHFEAESGSIFRITKAKESVRLLRLSGSSFYDTLRNKMMWGFDRRDGSKTE